MRRVFVVVVCSWVAVAAAQEPSTYAGDHQRAIKSLSDSEIRALQNGDGMGFALLAELNHYPGPRHVLDLAVELELSEEQILTSQIIFEDMLDAAITLGQQIIEEEGRLDDRFASGDVDSESLAETLLEIGFLRATLRYVHLEAHLRQRELLTDEQIQTYDRLRGYGDGNHENGDHTGHH